MATTELWTPILNTPKVLQTFDTFLNQVRQLDGSNFDSWVKWKDYENQIVVRTDNYFYKMYVTDKDSGIFQAIIREKLGEIYKGYGIIWNLFTVQSIDKVYTVEQRQKLDVCKDINYQQLLLNWGNTLRNLEHLLGFELLLKQIQEFYPEVKYIKLVRDCINKYDDFAIYNDKVILLDDADFFLCLLDDKLNVLSYKFNSHFVHTCGGNMLFAPLEYGNGSTKSNEFVDKWWLFPEDAGNGKTVMDFNSARTDMINTSTKLLAGMKELPDCEVMKILPHHDTFLLSGD